MTSEEFYDEYLRSIGKKRPAGEKVFAEKFGDSDELATKLCELIVTGKKTATCSSIWEWESGNDAMPYTGLITVVLDGAGTPRCIIETTELEIRKYSEVDQEFAAEEGEGDKSLKHWRGAHKDYFTRNLKKIGKEFSEDMPLLCERFRVVWK